MMSTWWQQLLLVAGGGAIGAAGRFLTHNWMLDLAGKNFPWGTLLVNLLGSLLAGLLFAWLTARQGADGLRLLLMVGVLGGFTTWSSFALETLLLGRNGEPGAAFAYVLASMLGGFLLVWIGFRLGLTLRG